VLVNVVVDLGAGHEAQLLLCLDEGAAAVDAGPPLLHTTHVSRAGSVLSESGVGDVNDAGGWQVGGVERRCFGGDLGVLVLADKSTFGVL
jgi:hypothetical protein